VPLALIPPLLNIGALQLGLRAQHPLLRVTVTKLRVALQTMTDVCRSLTVRAHGVVIKVEYRAGPTLGVHAIFMMRTSQSANSQVQVAWDELAQQPKTSRQTTSEKQHLLLQEAMWVCGPFGIILFGGGFPHHWAPGHSNRG
jgi:hypothetical protein